MYIVNTSFFVEPEAQSEWLNLIHEKYIPLLRENGFDVLAFTRVISVEPVDSFTYALLVEASDMDRYRKLTDEMFDEYRTVADLLFGDRVAWLTTLLKKIDK